MLFNDILSGTLFRCIKVPVLLLTSITYYLGLTAPNPPPSDKKGQAIDRVSRVQIFIGRATTIIPLLCECIIILALNYPSSYSTPIIANICPHAAPTLPINISALSAAFCVGVSAMISGAVLRMWCFDTLGKFFTYEVTIQPKHELVTSGPYSIVRHPSYTGAGLMVIGGIITRFAPGSFIYECNLLATPLKWIVLGLLPLTIFNFTALGRKAEDEDEALRKKFGEVWDRYSRAVPSRFIPYLF